MICRVKSAESFFKGFLRYSVLRASTKHLQWRRISNCPSLHTSRAEDSLSGSTRQAPGSELVIFYRWPTMRHFRFISRFKVYQVSTMLLLLPPMTWWYSTGVITGQTLAYALMSAAGAGSVLSMLSYYFTRVVGELSFLPDKSVIRVSTLTFMGNRRELEYPLSKIVPFSDSHTNMGGAFQRLEVIGERTYFLYSLRYGRVIDSTVMTNVLGIME